MTARRIEQAELLAALWKLGGNEDKAVPLSGGRLDKALEEMQSQWPGLIEGVSFSNTSVGRRCLELPDIVLAGEDAFVWSAESPAFVTLRVRLGTDAAREVAISHDLSTAQAASIGFGFRLAAEPFEREPTTVPFSP